MRFESGHNQAAKEVDVFGRFFNFSKEIGNLERKRNVYTAIKVALF